MDYLALLDAIPLLRATLPQNLVAALARTADITELKPGQALLQMKLPPPRVAYLTSGFAAYAVDGQNTLVDMCSQGVWLALPFCLNPDAPPPTIWSVSHAVVTTLPREELLRAAYASPNLALALTLAAADDARVAHSHRLALRTRSAEGRCAFILLDLAQRVYGSSSFECQLDQSMLASLAGLSRGAFNRALKSLAAQKLIVCDRSRYRLLNEELLRRID